MINFLVMDVDGTLTDGKIYVGNSGELMKAFCVKDGYAITNLLKEKHIVPIVITGRCSNIVKKRCEELKITELYQNCKDKKEKLFEVANKYNARNNRDILDDFAYIGDDIPDISPMQSVAYSGCPADACDDVKKISDYVCKKKGGEGAVREFVEWLLEKEKI